MTASAHPLVFRPLIALLRGRGDEVEITARAYAQTLQLIERHGLEAEVIGHHGGRSRLGKARQMTSRLRALRRWAQRPRLRPRARPRLARADHDRAAARHPELDDVRLRVGVAPAPARLPRSDAGRRPGGDPAQAARVVRRRPAEARPVRGAEGGVLPLRLRSRSGGCGGARRRPGPDARGAASSARRLAVPPALESALPADAAPCRRARFGPRGRPAADGRAARLRPLARAAVGARARTRRRRAEPHRRRGRRRVGRRDDEPRGGGARGARSTPPTGAASEASTRS